MDTGSPSPSSAAASGLVDARGYPSGEDVDTSGAGYRLRSASPYGYGVSNATRSAATRFRSGEGSGNSTPVPPGSGYRTPSGTRPLAQQAAARASYESALLAAVRRQIEAFEEKMGTQMSRIQQQSDRLREAAFTRLEEKMNMAEGLQPKLERRMAELTGQFKGLSDELQSQIRRVDSMDDRFWEWRHQMEEEMRQKHTSFETAVKQVESDTRVKWAAVEGDRKRHHQRMLKLEGDSSEVNAQIDELGRGLVARLETLEEQARALEDQAMSLSMVQAPSTEPSTGHECALSRDYDDVMTAAAQAQVQLLEKRVSDVAEKLEEMSQEVSEHTVKIASHEEQHKANRTRLDMREENAKSLIERVEHGNWDSKIEQIRQVLQDHAKQSLDQSQHNALFEQRLAAQEEAHEGLRHKCDQLTRSSRVAADPPADAHALEAAADGAILPDVRRRMDQLEREVEAFKADVGLGPRVGDLLEQLKNIVPKVIEQEALLRTFQEELLALKQAPPSPGSNGKDEQLLELGSLRESVSEIVEDVRATKEIHAKDVERLTQVSTTSGEQASTVLANVNALQSEVESLKREREAELSKLSSSSADAELLASLQSTVDRLSQLTSQHDGHIAELREQAPAAAEGRALDAEMRCKVEQRVERALDIVEEFSSNDFASKLENKLDSVKASVEKLSPLEGLDVAELREGHRKELAGLADELHHQIKLVQTEHVEQTQQLTALKDRLEQMSVDNGTREAEAGSRQKHFEEILAAIRADEDTEQQAETQVVERLQEVCERLVVLEKVLSAPAEISA